MPDNKIVRAAIHPGIGIARVGNKEHEFLTKAGRALQRHLSGEAGVLELYERHLGSIYDAYFQNRTMFYRYEKRWPASAFWKRRWNPAKSPTSRLLGAGMTR